MIGREKKVVFFLCFFFTQNRTGQSSSKKVKTVTGSVLIHEAELWLLKKTGGNITGQSSSKKVKTVKTDRTSSH